MTQDAAHLLEPLHPGLSLRSPLPTSSSPPAPALLHTSVKTVTLQPLSHQDHHQDHHQQQQLQDQQQQQQQARTISEFQLKCGFGWRRLQSAMFQCAACCVRCIGPVWSSESESTMSSRSRTRTSYGFNLGSVYSLGLSKSYGSSLGNGYNSYSSGYSPGGYSSYLSRANGYYSSSQATPDVYKKSYTNDNVYTSSNGSRRNYYRSKTESSFSSVLDNIKSSLTSWRSKSTDGYSRDSRSMSRDLYNNNNNRETSFDSFREPSLARDKSRDFSSYRSFTPSRDFTPSREFTPSSRRGSVAQEPLPPSRMRKFALHKSTSNLYDADESVSRNSLVRSSSYHDLQDSKKLQQQTRNSSFFGGNNSSNDLTRTRSIADLYSPRSEGWRGSGVEINGNNNSDRSSRPWRLSSMISLSGSFSDLGYQSQSSSRRESLAVRNNFEKYFLNRVSTCHKLNPLFDVS